MDFVKEGEYLLAIFTPLPYPVPSNIKLKKYELEKFELKGHIPIKCCRKFSTKILKI